MTPTRQAVWNKTGGHCAYCGLALAPDTQQSVTRLYGYQSFMEVDHVHPRKLGGIDAFENYVPSCTACNTSKGGKTLEEFRHYMAAREEGRPKITQEWRDWLTKHGFEFPPLPTKEFWFEAQGIPVHHVDRVEPKP
jgi:5-methylcytosine-specific restriction endonuclease McrA